MILGMSIATLVEVIFQKGLNMILGLLDFLQLINLIPLIPFNLPPNTRALFRLLSFANVNLGLFQKIYQLLYGDEQFNENSSAFNFNYEEYDIFQKAFDNLQSMVNQLQDIMFCIGLAIYSLLKRKQQHIQIKSRGRPFKNCLVRCIVKQKQVLMFNAFIIYFNEVYVEICICCFLNLLQPLQDTYLEIGALYLTYISITLITFVPILILIFYNLKINQIRECSIEKQILKQQKLYMKTKEQGKLKYQKFQIIEEVFMKYRVVESENTLTNIQILQTQVFFYGRRFLIPAALILLQNNFAQWSVFILSSIIILTRNIEIKPYKLKRIRRSYNFHEVILISILIILPVFEYLEDYDLRYNIGWLVNALVILDFFIVISYVVYSGLLKIAKKIRSKCKNKKQKYFTKDETCINITTQFEQQHYLDYEQDVEKLENKKTKNKRRQKQKVKSVIKQSPELLSFDVLSDENHINQLDSGAKHKSQKQKANNTNLKNKKKSNPKSKRKRQQLISETLGNNQTTINQINIEDLSHQDISNVQDISSNPSQLFDNFDGNTREETVSNSLKDKLAEIKQQNRGSFEENYQIYDYDFEDVKNRFKANHNIEIQSSARSRII